MGTYASENPVSLHIFVSVCISIYAYTHRHKYMQTNRIFTRYHLSRF